MKTARQAFSPVAAEAKKAGIASVDTPQSLQVN